MSKRLSFVLVFLIIAGLATSASARGGREGGGMYFGAGLGSTFYSNEVEDALDQFSEIDENATAWKIFGGFRGKKIFGIEGGYRQFGEAEATIGNSTFKSKTDGWDIEALGRFEIAIFDIFGKAGAMFWSTEASIDDVGGDTSGTDFLWGLGAGARLGPLGVRLEWESVTISGPEDLSMVSISATLGF